MKRLLEAAGTWALILACAYIMVAVTVYRFRHPELTETQLFLDVPEALLLR